MMLNKPHPPPKKRPKHCKLIKRWFRIFSVYFDLCDILGSYPKKSPLDLGKGTVREASKTKPLFSTKNICKNVICLEKRHGKNLAKRVTPRNPSGTWRIFLIPSSKCNDRGGDWQWGSTLKRIRHLSTTQTLSSKSQWFQCVVFNFWVPLWLTTAILPI